MLILKPVVITTVYLSGVLKHWSVSKITNLWSKMPEPTPEINQDETKEPEQEEGGIDKEQDGETKTEEKGPAYE